MNIRNRTVKLSWLFSALIIAFLAFLSSRSSQAAANSATLGCADVRVSGQTTSYLGCSYAGARSSAETTARAFLSANADALNFDSGSVADMALVEVKNGLASTHTRLEQVYNGYPVFGGTLVVSQGPDGAVQTLHTAYVSGLNGSGTATKSAAEAEASAMQAAGATALRFDSPSRLVWFPYKDSAILAWE
ncbi:MAG TPA: hypothetical protein ENJ56_05095, partial [Anaerolineae bacterium]|nr:hypothetical protein [Anaerolineae bacterium]